MLLFSLYGSQDGEVFALTWQDLDLTNKLLYVRKPKNDEARHAYLTPNLVGIFKNMPKGKNNCLIFPDRNGKRIDQLSDTFDRAVVKLGLNNGVTDRLNKVVPHTLRHTFASWLA
ncbi:MAG TPA: site-specific integrase, partial [Nitrospinaceae bacterium]|nr:site-specific integrase [Nitrospinaceae bacterium]